MADSTGREVVPCRWQSLTDMSGGVAVAGMTDGRSCRFALVDTLGRVRELPYDCCSGFENGLAVVGTGEYRPREERELTPGVHFEKGLLHDCDFVGKYGYMTPDGRTAIPLRFDGARSFSDDGLAVVGMQGKYYVKWGLSTVRAGASSRAIITAPTGSCAGVLWSRASSQTVRRLSDSSTARAKR